MKNQIDTIQKQAETQIQKIEHKIENVRQEKKYLYDLLTGTNRELVEAVIQALYVLGFQEIIDVDEEIKEKSQNTSLREDIQVKDQSPLLIVDVKGIMNLSRP